MRKAVALALAGLVILAGCGAAQDASVATAKAHPQGSATIDDESTQTPITTQCEVEPLTPENCADLQAMLVGPATGPSVETVSEKHRARVVSFDGYVADKYVNPREHFGESTIDVRAGDAGAKKHTGPVFQIGWYGHDDPIEKFKVGEKVRVTALLGMVYEFDPHQVFLVADDSTPALSRR